MRSGVPPDAGQKRRDGKTAFACWKRSRPTILTQMCRRNVLCQQSPLRSRQDLRPWFRPTTPQAAGTAPLPEQSARGSRHPDSVRDLAPPMERVFPTPRLPNPVLYDPKVDRSLGCYRPLNIPPCNKSLLIVKSVDFPVLINGSFLEKDTPFPAPRTAHASCSVSHRLPIRRSASPPHASNWHCPRRRRSLTPAARWIFLENAEK